MRSTLYLAFAAAAAAPVVLAACGDATPPATPRAPIRALAAPPAAVADASAAAAVSIEPTTLTAAQKQKDAALVATATSIVDAYPNWNGFFSSLVANFTPDGKRIVFGSLRDGAPEIYIADVNRPGDPPRALTIGPERALTADITTDGKTILFLRDEKGDENHAIWRVNLDGTGLVNLTPGEKLLRDQPVIPPGKPRTMFFDQRKHGELSSTIVMQNIDGGEPKVVLSDARRVYVNDVTPDGTRVLLLHVRGKNDFQALELEVASGKTRVVYPRAGDGANVSLFGVSYSADGKRLFISTDEGKESSTLLAIDAATGKEELARYVNDLQQATLNFQVAAKGDHVALRVDYGNHGEVRILDARTLRVIRNVKVPLGDVSLGSFTRDGRAFSLLVSLPNQPADLFSVEVATGDVRPLRRDQRAGLDALTPIEASLATAQAHDGLSIPINVYLPKRDGLNAPKKLPTLAIFHGGPNTSYAVRWSLYARFFVSLGYAVLEPNVRGSSGFGRAYERADDREKRADWLKDVETVNTWAKSQAWCDPNRVVVWGQSYGGYTTLMALTRQPTIWSAGVDLYGMADMKTFLRSSGASGQAYLAGEFGDLAKDSALLEEFSPMRDADKIVRPLFVYAGQNDPRVPRAESDAIVRAMRTRGMPVEYMVAPNEGHGVDHRETKIELMTRTARFLADALGQEGAAVPR